MIESQPSTRKGRATVESVFIAWSGNLGIAKNVANLLEEKGFHAVVGGGTPHDMFIGTQVLSQMDTCAHAIILAQRKNDTSAGEPAKFSENLMFEWGYMIARLASKNVYAFLLDTGERELPSDLMGSWVIPIQSAGLSENETAARIVERFEVESRSLDKMAIMSQWKEIKTLANQHVIRNKFSDFEMAQMVLFSLKSAYYHNEMPLMFRGLSYTGTIAGMLGAAIEEACAIASIFVKTDDLKNRLQIEDYFEITTFLSKEFEREFDDPSLANWAKILRFDAISLCNVIAPEGLDQTERDYYWKESLFWGTKTLAAIEEDVADHPENDLFASLMRSYQYRNQAKAHRELGDEAKAVEYLGLSVKERERFYFGYKSSFPDDSVLCSKLAQEYYLSLLERARFEGNPIEKRRIMTTVEKLMVSWREDFERQQALLDMVRSAYDALLE